MNRTFTDHLGRSVLIESPPRRIISLVPSQTELLYDLELNDRVVGITKFCVRPDEWFRTKTRVGGTKKLHVDKIREINPDLIMANKEENTADDIDALSQEFPVWVSDVNGLESAIDMIRNVSKICEVEPKGNALIDEIQHQFKSIKNIDSSSCLYLIWDEPVMVAGNDTFIHEMLRFAGFKNLSDADRYPSLEEGRLVDLAPDYLLLSSEPFPFKEKHVERFKNLLPKTKVMLVDGEMFSWYGSRLTKAPAYFKELQLNVSTL
ncbi:MAG: ABC transporter substrate-binding protein [Bacteroidetes bacterium]|nr:ABC transporter substrate-binding protein [Bacteroidota bacterium]